MRKVKVILNCHGLVVEAVIKTGERLARLKDYLESNVKVEVMEYVDEPIEAQRVV